MNTLTRHIICILLYLCMDDSVGSMPQPTEDDQVPGEYIVSFNQRISSEAMDSMFTACRFTSVRLFSFKRLSFAVVKGDDESINILKKSPDISLINNIEPNRIIKVVTPVESTPVSFTTRKQGGLGTFEVSNDTRRCKSQSNLDDQAGWGLVRTSYSNRPAYGSTPYLYENEGSDVDIYVLDTGIDFEHVDFNGRAVPGMISYAHKEEGPLDYKGHGTHVAGIAAGTLYGIAKNATIISGKVLDRYGGGCISDAIEGLMWVTEQVMEKRAAGKPAKSIINLSLGGTSNSGAFLQAINRAAAEGIIIVVAAGNDAIDGRYYYPSAYDNTIAVASSTNVDQFSSFSNYGTSVDLIAPGSNVMAAGSRDSNDCFGKDPNYCFVRKSGTSMAAPHVCGIVARYLSELSDSEAELANHDVVLKMLTETATVNKISFSNEEQSLTPNRLIRRECTLGISSNSNINRINFLYFYLCLSAILVPLIPN